MNVEEIPVESTMAGQRSDATRSPVVVGVDGSLESAAALHQARGLARILDAPLEILWAWHIPSMSYAGYPAAIDWSPSDDARRALDAAVRNEFGDQLPPGVMARTKTGAAASVLLHAAARGRLLVVGGRGHGGFTGLLLGSVSEACARHAACPVLVVRDAVDADELEDDTADDRPIIAGVDGSEHSIEALRIAAELARRIGAPLQVILAWHEPLLFGGGLMPELSWSPSDDAESALTQCVLDAFGSDRPPRMTAETRHGRPAEVLNEAAVEARLLVVGSRGRGGFASLLLGSVAEACVRHSSSSVLVVHGDADDFIDH